MASVGKKLSAAAGMAANPPRAPPRTGRDSEAGRLLRAGYEKGGKPRAVAVKLSPNANGERYHTEQYNPVRELKAGVLKPGNRYGPLTPTDDEEAAAAAAAVGDEHEVAAGGDGEAAAAGDEHEVAAGGDGEAAAAAGGEDD